MVVLARALCRFASTYLVEPLQLLRRIEDHDEEGRAADGAAGPADVDRVVAGLGGRVAGQDDPRVAVEGAERGGWEAGGVAEGRGHHLGVEGACAELWNMGFSSNLALLIISGLRAVSMLHKAQMKQETSLTSIIAPSANMGVAGISAVE